MLTDGLMTYNERRLRAKENGQNPAHENDGSKQAAKEPQSNLCFAVYDKVKFKVETTTEFPLDIKCKMLITEDDMIEYEEIKQLQAARSEAQMEKTGDDGEGRPREIMQEVDDQGA